MAARKSPLINTATTLGKVIAFFLASAVAGLLVAGTMVPLAIGASSATTMAGDTYASIQIPKTTATIAQPSVLLDRDGKELAKFFTQNREVVKLKNISPWMSKAVISVEDERFYEHGGVDGKGIARAVVSNLTGSRQGASTITQQYVANLLVNDQQASGMSNEEIARNGNKKVGDKVREIKWANQIETKMSKDEILQGYLNLVPFAGATYGVEAAAQRWFSKPASKLNIQESALLAGMVQSPIRINPVTNPQNSLKRRNVVLGTMLKTGAITKAQYDKAVKTKIVLDESKDASGCSGDSAYFCNYVFNDIGNNPAFGKTKKDRQNLLYSGGLTITSTLDSKMQKEAVKQTRITVPAGDKGGAGASLLTRNNKTGEILAMAQNTDFGIDKKNPDRFTEVNYNTNGYQGGSTAKPWTAVAWLEAGNSMGTRVDAKRQNYDGTSWKASCVDGGRVHPGQWRPKNATANMNYPMAASAGLYWSINSATVAEAYKLDLCDIADVPERLGLLEGQTTGSPSGELVPATKKALVESGPAFILGAQNVTALAQARAFGVFANEGKRCESTPYVSVKSKSGEIKLPESECKQVIDADVVQKLNGTLKPLASTRPTNGRGSTAGALISGDIGGKTGTSNYATSTWFAGYTSDITTISWVGRKDGKTYQPGLNKNYGLNSGLKIRGKRTPSSTDSSTFASPLWTRYMAQVANRFPTENIPSVGPFTKNYKNSGTGGSGESGTTNGQAPTNRQGTANRQNTSTRQGSATSSKAAKDKEETEEPSKSPESTKKPEPTKEPEQPEPTKTKKPKETTKPKKND